MPWKIAIKRAQGAEDLPLPSKATEQSVGFDLHANLPPGVDVRLGAGERRSIPCGIKLDLPWDWEAQIRPRSGLAFKHGITVLNAPGTIDSDYRGEIAAILVNHSGAPYTVRRGDRIAQIIFARVDAVALEIVEDLSSTSRGEAGFGSSGK